MSERFESVQPQPRIFSEPPVMKRVKLEQQKTDQSILLNEVGDVQIRLTKKFRECREALGDIDVEHVVQNSQDYYKWHMLNRLLRDGSFDPYRMIDELIEKDEKKFNEDAFWKAVDAVELYNRGY